MKKVLIIAAFLGAGFMPAMAQYTPIVYTYGGNFNEESSSFGLRITSTSSNDGHTYHGDFLIVFAQRSGGEAYHFRLNSEYRNSYHYFIERVSGATYSDDIQIIQNTSTAFNMEIRFHGSQDDWNRITVHELSAPRGSTPTFAKIDASEFQSGTKVNTTIVNKSGGNVGIGTINTFGYRLAVNGAIGAKEVNVEVTSDWPDFVFGDAYELRSLEEVERYISQHRHLPAIPGEAEVTEHGINLGEMNAKLLQKIEELTLYLIEQNKQNRSQQDEIAALKERINLMENRLKVFSPDQNE
ncbi:hypothetical protein [Marinoscillum sp.]|uniref:hypothetical protein n=1 Tax=Marinoscillum sp. TaxID=2024838 RepID=UPI003BAD67E6